MWKIEYRYLGDFKINTAISGRPISIGQADSGQQVVGLAADETYSRARFLERTGQSACPEFLIYNRELLQSFLNTDFAPPVKLTGFENLYKHFQETEFGNEIWLHHRGPLN
ncbi:MAG: hypothetical protein H7256_06150 [Bdellovibrio sp.]|nr:hypothetical protein [Bdellovibrio sp.]